MEDDGKADEDPRIFWFTRQDYIIQLPYQGTFDASLHKPASSVITALSRKCGKIPPLKLRPIKMLQVGHKEML